jgi:hypothetical protein
VLPVLLQNTKGVMKKSVVTIMSLRSGKDVGTYLLKSRSDDNEITPFSAKREFRFAITRVIVLASSHLFLTEGMYTSGYITVNVTKRLKN